MYGLKRMMSGLRGYPTVGVSLAIILLLLGICIYARIQMPLSEAIELWNADHGVWTYSPEIAPPVWTNWFRRDNLPETIIRSFDDAKRSSEPLNATAWRETVQLTFNYDTAHLPSETKFFYNVSYATKVPMLTLTWIKPDGSEIVLSKGAARGGPSVATIDVPEAFSLTSSSSTGMKSTKDGENASAQLGTYTLRIEALWFEREDVSIDGQLVVYGRVHGIAGTDSQRRDLSIGLMWGTPIALMIGFAAALGTTIFSFVIAAIGSWLGGWVDATIQRITEISMMIPFLPTILMVGWFYSSSIWVLLAFIVGFSLFSGPLKTYRSMFLQITHSQYIQAARAYGASNTRIIFRYLIPRLASVLLPRIILGVPSFVFLEASLAFLGISDPKLPTWGKILSEAREALFMGHYHWVLGPAFMLLLTGLSFSMLGYALDRIVNPKLRDF